MWLRKKSKKIRQQILNSLSDEDDYKEVIYWRKNYLIHEWFCDNFEIENCEYVEVTKEELLELIGYLNDENKTRKYNKEEHEDIDEDIEKLKEVVEKTDWENEGIYYHAWW